MPKLVDHQQRRRDLAGAVWRVIARDGVAEVSIRAVAAESGWSSGALRHYFATRAELLAFACEEVIEQVTARLATMPLSPRIREAAEEVLLQTMPVDAQRHTESAIAFAFLALGLGDPELARVQRLHFTGMYELCLRLITQLVPAHPAPVPAARHLHALVDGLTVHGLAGHLTPAEMIAQLSAHLDDLTALPRAARPGEREADRGQHRAGTAAAPDSAAPGERQGPAGTWPGIMRGMPLLAALLDNADLDAALSTPEGTFARHDLLGWAASIAADLAGAPIVAVHALPGAPTVAAITGALLAGVPVVPVPPDAGVLEREHMLRDSGARLLLTDDPAHAGGLPVVPITRTMRATTIPAEPAPGSPALVLYTSGTTGAPKGVVISRAAIAADLDALAAAWQWTAADTLVHGLPLYHVHGLVLGVLGPLRLGGRLTHTGKPSPEAYARSLGSMYFGVPTVWSRIAARPDAARSLAPARLLVSGSAPLPAPVFHTLRELTGQAPVERYGMTETLITVSARAGGDRRPGQVGLPLDGITTRLVGERGEALEPDGTTIGQLQVRGPTLFDGYLRGGAVEPRGDDWYPTGDVATIAPDGWHRIVGRASTDLIKTGGYRVGAGEVEDVLLLHPAVGEAAVIGLPDADLGERITAFVVADGPVAEAELIAFVAGRLAAHKRPRSVRLVEALPRNTMGKVQKSRLRDL